MADSASLDAMKAELAELRSQMQNILKKAEEKEKEAQHRLGEEFDHYRQLAHERGEQLRVMSEAGLDEVSAQIRRYPLASLGIAFGAGWLLSCFFRHLR